MQWKNKTNCLILFIRLLILRLSKSVPILLMIFSYCQILMRTGTFLHNSNKSHQSKASNKKGNKMTLWKRWKIKNIEFVKLFLLPTKLVNKSMKDLQIMLFILKKKPSIRQKRKYISRAKLIVRHLNLHY